MAEVADNQQVGAGQMFPQDTSNEYLMLAFIVRQMIAEMETCTPVSVKAVHAGSGSPPAGGTVDVQLLVSLLDGNGNATKQGIVYGLPYFRMQAGPWAIIADPASNDFGFIISASRDISNVVKTPGQANPGSFRQHSFSDGFFIPCGFSSAAPAGTIWLKSDGTLQITTQDGVVLKSDGSGNLVGSATALKWTGDITVTGNITATGSITAGQGGADQVGLQTHKHTANNVSPTPGT